MPKLKPARRNEDCCGAQGELRNRRCRSQLKSTAKTQMGSVTSRATTYSSAPATVKSEQSPNGFLKSQQPALPLRNWHNECGCLFLALNLAEPFLQGANVT